MIVLPNGKEYKIVYLDTNAISEFVNNTSEFAKNFLLDFCYTGEYSFATSPFNLYELSKTLPDFQKKFENNFGLIPLGIANIIPQVCEYEKENIKIGNSFISFVVGIKPLFNADINDLLNLLDNELKRENDLREQLFCEEIAEWEATRKKNNPSWQKKFQSNILFSANEIYAHYPSYKKIETLGQYKSLEVAAFIKNKFIHNTNVTIKKNSIIDSYNAAILPYVDVYITEKTVGSWLDEAKTKLNYLTNIKIIKLSDLFSK